MSQAQQLITDNIATWTSAILAKSSAGRGSSNKYELYGIKKLRELILELAVRGKLVPQDPTDEPASVLLERIAAEKAELIKAKKIKKPKALPVVSEGEIDFELPASWEWSRLGLIASYGNLNKVEAKAAKPETWVLELEDIEKETSRLLTKIRFSERKFKSTKNVFKPLDVLYGKLRPYLDKVLVSDEAGVCTTEIIPITCYADFSPFYLRCFLKSPSFIKYADSSTHGMSLPRLGTDKAVSAIVPLPPVSEQQRIVAKVDELMALCDQLEQQTEASIDAHATLVEILLSTLTDSADADELAQNWGRIAEHFDTLFTTDKSIDALKQTILQLAVMGKLVPQNPDDEPASVLLDKIATEKAILVKEKKIKKQKPLPPISDDEKPFELPKGWDWCRFGDIAHQITDGAHHTPTYIDSGVPFLSVKDMSSGALNFSDTRFISREQHQDLTKRCNPQKGDLLLTKVGTTGIPIIIDTDIEFSIFVSVALIKFPADKVSGSYLSTLIKSPFIYQQSQEGTQGVGNKNLVLKTIASFRLIMPPLTEQHRIVAKVDELMAICDQLKDKLKQSRQTQVHLTDALVNQALA
ncbi:restriction endonuclease subunit S [Oceanisphaera sediminis]|uniref:Restriction endonuclease subunit S n=1 Tax=Oceanisphaera sediminis TaxID=981381 RepID=A0ABP7E708_9GAMM